MEAFRTFKDAPAAADLAEWLRTRDIPAEVRDTGSYFDPSFAHSILTREWTVCIPAADFTRATRILHHFYEQRLDRVPPDYYLFAFSDGELEAILARPDEWGDLDYTLARQILGSRGCIYTDEELDKLRQSRYQDLSRPDDASSGNLVAWGYALSLTAGLIGSLFGWYIMHSQKILPDGNKVPRFTSHARRHGRYILRIGIGLTILFAVFRMYFMYQRDIGSLF